MTPNINPEDRAAFYRKKPVCIEAWRLTDRNQKEVAEWCRGGAKPHGGVLIQTLEGNVLASVGDWVIKGVKGEFYPCKPDIFSATYEDASAPAEDRAALADEQWVRNLVAAFNDQRDSVLLPHEYFARLCAIALRAAPAVPREPTAQMFRAGTKALAEAESSYARHVWQAMYDAAPDKEGKS